MKDVTLFSAPRAGLIVFTTISFFFAQNFAVFGEIIPASRRPTWQGNVGVPGGIPNRTVIYQTFNPGATVAQIEAAINSCPAGQVVKLNAGTYNFSTQLRIYNKGDWTLRGAGMGKTIITGGSGSLFALGQMPWITEWPAPIPINSGYTESSTSITLPSTSGIAVGKLLFLEQDNDSQVFGYGVGGTGSPTSNSSGRLRDGNRVLSQIVMVTGISGSTVTFTPPLNFSFNAARNPQAVSFGNFSGLKNAGIEDLTVAGASGGMGVWWMGSYGCWMKNVELTQWGTFGFEVQYCVNMEIRSTYIHEPYAYNWGKGYAVQFDQANNSLVEDNLFWKFQDGIILQSGCSGNVIAYNCLFQSYPAYNGVETMLSSLFGNHTPYPLRNLFEGNFANGFHSDFYFGPSREGVLFRNYFTGSDPDVRQNRIVVNLDSNQKNYSVVGNILGSSGTNSPIFAALPSKTISYVNTVPLSWTYDSGSTSFSTTENVIYRLGYPYVGNNGIGSGLAAYDSSVRPSTLIHGNYDQASKTVKWDPNISDQNIPNSYYLLGKPSWFGNLAWPPYDPSKGASMTPMNMTNIPAGYRFIYGTNPPAGPSGPVNNPPVAVANANPASGLVPLNVAFSSAGSYDPEETPLIYNWTFGDGTTSTQANPNHTYHSASNYVARLQVSDGTNTVFSGPITITAFNQGSGNGLVAAYGFGEGGGGITADSSENNNFGSLNAATWTAGRFGTALAFDGNAVVTVKDSASLDLTNAMTIEAWVYPTAANGVNIIYKDTMSYYLVGSTPEVSRPGGGGSFGPALFGPAPLPLNTWSHVATTYDGTALRLYVNGTQVSNRPQTGQISATANDLMIGGNSLVPGKNWFGRIDEVRIYNRALSAEEIANDMVTPVATATAPLPPTGLRIITD